MIYIFESLSRFVSRTPVRSNHKALNPHVTPNLRSISNFGHNPTIIHETVFVIPRNARGIYRTPPTPTSPQKNKPILVISLTHTHTCPFRTGSHLTHHLTPKFRNYPRHVTFHVSRLSMSSLHLSPIKMYPHQPEPLHHFYFTKSQNSSIPLINSISFSRLFHRRRSEMNIPATDSSLRTSNVLVSVHRRHVFHENT